jgi:hypothetical protein
MGFWGTALSFGLPIVGNLILPGAGGFIGAAVGNIAAEAIDGNIDSWGDAFAAGGVGAIGAFAGGALGRGLLSRFGRDAASPERWQVASNLGLFQNAPRNGRYIGDTLGKAFGSLTAHKVNEYIPGMGSIFGNNSGQQSGPMKVINIGNGPD